MRCWVQLQLSVTPGAVETFQQQFKSHQPLLVEGRLFFTWFPATKHARDTCLNASDPTSLPCPPGERWLSALVDQCVVVSS